MTTKLQENPEINPEELLDLVVEHWDCLTGTNQELWRALKRNHIRAVQQRQRNRYPTRFASLAGRHLGIRLLQCLAEETVQVSAVALSCLAEACLTSDCSKVQLGDGCRAVTHSSKPPHLAHWLLMSTLQCSAQAVPYALQGAGGAALAPNHCVPGSQSA